MASQHHIGKHLRDLESTRAGPSHVPSNGQSPPDRDLKLLTSLYGLCVIAMHSADNYFCLIRLAKSNEAQPDGSKLLGMRLKCLNSLRPAASMVRDVNSDIVSILAMLQQTNMDQQYWQIPSFRSLIDTANGITPLVKLIERHNAIIFAALGRKERLSGVKDTDLMGLMASAFTELTFLQQGSEERGITSWKGCIRDVNFVVKSTQN